MSERLEGSFWGYQDVELHYQVWKPQTSVGFILITHGIAEHSDCYQHLAEDLCRLNFTVMSWDLRGHGRSEGKRGYVNRFQDFCNDLDAAIKFVKAQASYHDLPLVLFGHSLGGLITIKTMINHCPSKIVALALSSPALGLGLKIPALKEKAAEFLATWMPKVTLHNEIDFDVLVRDDRIVSGYKTDPLRHDRISPNLFLGMTQAMTEVSEHASELYLPIIMQLAGKEKVVSNSASEKFFDKVSSQHKELLVYSESYHEIFNDLDRKQVISDLVKHLNKIIANGKSP